MGYTHYFNRENELDAELFDKASKDCQLVCHGSDINIQFEYDEPNLPIFTKDLIRFNGVGDEGHETFYVSRVFHPDYPEQNINGRGSAFCKTAEKPYDTLVTACLIIFKHYFGDSFNVTSDGVMADWKDGMQACQDALGYGNDFKIKR